ncbi:hypothetical protein HDF18_06780 [Mucilaginibacter sp. X5P1]|uniref:hypothetical protein n=1 Tax=Mucilaginibacter sp. X5P1 TaxID=2723088 RepID=UPI001618F509|nr:hypothetical protein [Mucilaginibacter sp. X5P1]MBB6137344.1 hypothetical protein [Mucilaginibacter sp. X5P1]
MKKIPLTLITVLFFLLITRTTGNAQVTDSTLRKKLTINGFCLCQTSLQLLKQSYPNLKETSLEEMDLPRGCLGQDARYIAGNGYCTDKQPGLIFQKDQQTDYISKIRLTKQFKGYLPNGKYIDMSTAKLKDLANLYPELKDQWGSRGCSDYWNFSNDTISFYVKIDMNLKPQFPINKAYYMDKPIEGIDLTMSCYSLQKDKAEVDIFDEDTKEPVYFLDSIRVNKMVLSNYQPSEIALVSVYKDSTVIKKLFPPGAKNGLIYIETKDFVKHRYWKYFKSKSADYAKIYPSMPDDSTVQYILNEKVLKEDYENDLPTINDTNFKTLTIINKQELIKKYGIKNKDYGVIIIDAKIASKSH